MKSKAKHTPGPWKTQGTAIWTDTNGVPYLVATATKSTSPSNGIDHLANATLIATAPEMLEALENIKAYLLKVKDENPEFEHWLWPTAECAKAIKKARGE